MSTGFGRRSAWFQLQAALHEQSVSLVYSFNKRLMLKYESKEISNIFYEHTFFSYSLTPTLLASSVIQ